MTSRLGKNKHTKTSRRYGSTLIKPKQGRPASRRSGRIGLLSLHLSLGIIFPQLSFNFLYFERLIGYRGSSGCTAPHCNIVRGRKKPSRLLDKCAVEEGFLSISIYNAIMIGVFDSGYGGLTILKEIIKRLPEYDYLYLADNARYPYGNRSKETIIEFTDGAVRHLFESGCQLIIVACFTASSLALREMQEKYIRNKNSKYKDGKILGVLLPVVEKAIQITKKGRIGVVATRGTIDSNSFGVELKKLKPKIMVLQYACPLLVPLIEENWHKKPETKMILKKYLRPLKSQNPDTLILGCTHYPYLLRDFKRIMGKNINIINPPEVVAESLGDYLNRHPEIEQKLTRSKKRMFQTTDNVKKFREFLDANFGKDSAQLQQVGF